MNAVINNDHRALLNFILKMSALCLGIALVIIAVSATIERVSHLADARVDEEASGSYAQQVFVPPTRGSDEAQSVQPTRDTYEKRTETQGATNPVYGLPQGVPGVIPPQSEDATTGEEAEPQPGDVE